VGWQKKLSMNLILLILAYLRFNYLKAGINERRIKHEETKEVQNELALFR
jgi:hypothetical protein